MIGGLSLAWAINHLERGGQLITAMVAGMAADQARWRPASDAWSALEVINHLGDEEAEDFRQRLDLCLHRPGVDFPPIDPVGWVTARSYNERDLSASITRFRDERQQSLAWLGGLVQPDWSASRSLGAFTLTAGDLLASWVAHDLLHLRQLVELRYHWLAHQAEPASVLYAGDWSTSL